MISDYEAERWLGRGWGGMRRVEPTRTDWKKGPGEPGEWPGISMEASQLLFKRIKSNIIIRLFASKKSAGQAIFLGGKTS